MSSRDVNRDIDVTKVAYQCWHASERDFGMRAPATEHVRVGGNSAEVWFRRQISAHVRARIPIGLSQ